jgi:membrane protease YdiL (CAAX protease family)
MNILIVMAVAAAGLGLLWIVQSIALIAAGEPLAWPLRFETEKPAVKWTSRIMIHVVWIMIIVVPPILLKSSPIEWLHQEFPTPIPWRSLAVAASIVLFPTWAIYAVWIAAGWVRIAPRYDPARRRAKLFRRFIGPWPLATLEEAVFRGVILEQLLRSLPASTGSTVTAVIVTSLVFSSVHFFRRHHDTRRMWQAAWGLFLVGCLFGLAYIVGGRSLWLPIAVHGTAVFAIETMRLYVVFVGPPWLIGYGPFPQSGLMGGLLVLGIGAALVFVH